MPFNRYENQSQDNPLPVEEIDGMSYNPKEPISETNPLPVMVVEGQSYSPYSDVSETNPWPVVVISGDEEPAGYTTGAVHFDGATGLGIASLSATDGSLCSFVYWIKSLRSDANSTVLWVVDPENTYPSYSSLVVPLAESQYQISSLFADASGGNALELSTNDQNEPMIQDDTWTCVMVTVDTQARVGIVYVNGLKSMQDFPIIPGGTSFDMVFNGLGFKVADDGYGQAIIGDLADFRFMPGVSLLDTGDNISAETIALFMDENGKPVDPAVATAELGAPAILFRRDPAAAASTFANNLGTGGAFTISGTLTNATTSPSD